MSSSGKTQGGTLHSVGGAGFDDYYGNLIGVFEGDQDEANAVVEEMRQVLRPTAGGGYAYGTSSPSPQQNQPRGNAGSPPGAQTLCPSHQQAAVWKDGGVSKSTGKSYTGFWKCPQNDSIITDHGGALKSSCPPPK